MKAQTCIRRSAAMLSTVRMPVGISLVLGLVVAGLPFVANAALGPVMQLIANAGASGNLGEVWALDGAMLSRGDGASPAWLGWLTVSVPFAVLFAVWAVSLVAVQILDMVKSWIDSRVERRLLTEIRQQVHDHIQELTLDFFTGARIGALMQRVQMEAGGVQRLLTDCLIPPVIDTVVLILALGYLLALSW